MARFPRRVLLVQLPIPPPGPQPIRGNVPLAAGYLKLLARKRGLEAGFEIDIFPPRLANSRSDQGLVADILAREPWLVGFTCYLWNIDRTLWIAQRLKQQRPELRIMLGGPEITADNSWVLEHSAIDYAAIGEGEQTFCELLGELQQRDELHRAIDGLFVRNAKRPAGVSAGALSQLSTMPAFRRPLESLNEISSPYLDGILDAADEQMLLLETIRGCIFKCKFCYYPKSYDGLYFVDRERIVANLLHARERGAREVVLLDPTLNQRRDFAEFLELLAKCNPERQFTYFGELRGEGITDETARLLRAANFTEVEIGLQSIDRQAQDLMDRRNNLKAFERGAKAMLDQGIQVKVDLIIGLPGDTVDSVRRGIDHLRDSGLYTNVQVFNLAILPGTAFRQEAQQLGLKFQPRPPYYALRTPTLDLPQMVELMQEAQDALGLEWDAMPPPELDFSNAMPADVARFDLDVVGQEELLGALPEAAERAQAFTLWLRSHDFRWVRGHAVACIERVLADNPHSTLQVVLEALGDPRTVTSGTLEALTRACFRDPSYLDRFYSLQAGRPQGAKRIVVLVPAEARGRLAADWGRTIGQFGTLVWRGEEPSPAELEEHEYVIT